MHMHAFKDITCASPWNTFHTDLTNNVCHFFSQLCLNGYQDLLNLSHLIAEIPQVLAAQLNLF